MYPLPTPSPKIKKGGYQRCQTYYTPINEGLQPPDIDIIIRASIYYFRITFFTFDWEGGYPQEWIYPSNTKDTPFVVCNP